MEHHAAPRPTGIWGGGCSMKILLVPMCGVKGDADPTPGTAGLGQAMIPPWTTHHNHPSLYLLQHQLPSCPPLPFFFIYLFFQKSSFSSPSTTGLQKATTNLFTPCPNSTLTPGHCH